MKTQLFSLALVASLTACGSGGGGNPFDQDTEEETTEEEVGGVTEEEVTGINRDGIPPGTASPTPSDGIFRSEPTVDTDGVDAGNGFATGIAFNSENDTFTVDNLAFDGDRPYDRGTAVSSLSPDPNNLNANGDPIGRFNVYEGPTTAIDPVTGVEVDQFVYRAVYGVSTNRIGNTDQPTTQFAIVRTGSFIDYGFGGFIYQRDNGVTLPTQLQATFTGHSAGLRDFANSGGLQYTTADVEVSIDFQDFNDGSDIRGDGVNGRITNRRILDLDGNDITEVVATSLGEGVTSIPNVSFEVGPDVLDNNGDIVTNIQSILPDGTTYETGTFFAIVSGDNPDEIVGVFVLESGGQDLSSRDTGGFIVYRGEPE